MRIISKMDSDESIYIDNSASYVHFDKCIFSDVMIGGAPKSLNNKLKFTDITCNDCKVVDAIIYAVDFKNLLIHNLSTKKRIDICHALFENCVFSGKIGSLMILDTANRIKNIPSLELEVLNYNKEAYSKMDWALDISNADFTEFDCRCVPAEKIIINNNSQIAVDLNKMKNITKFSDGDMKSMWEIYTKTVNRDFTGYNFVLTTSKRTKRHEEELRFFDFIRENGCELKRYE